MRFFIGTLASVLFAVIVLSWAGVRTSVIGLDVIASTSKQPELSVGDLVVTRSAPAHVVQTRRDVDPAGGGGEPPGVRPAGVTGAETSLRLERAVTGEMDRVGVYLFHVPRGGVLLSDGLLRSLPWLTVATGIAVALAAVPPARSRA